MANLHRNETAKLAANFLNTCAASLITVGIFTPTAAYLYGITELKEAWLLDYLPYICICGSIVLHLFGIAVLRLMEDTP
jgi:Na+-driven multidrug efflux pump